MAPYSWQSQELFREARPHGRFAQGCAYAKENQIIATILLTVAMTGRLFSPGAVAGDTVVLYSYEANVAGEKGGERWTSPAIRPARRGAWRCYSCWQWWGW